ncbi:ras guanine nucleotide exchange factor domain-containing protein [Cladochytrium replicatum]|nr:ras guanine nucleotide exchange factor domain-containing protein [Cladochytrium replicatum]
MARRTTSLMCTALYDYSGSEMHSLSFREGDTIQVITQLDSGWWDGICNNQRGWFPSNYVTNLHSVMLGPDPPTPTEPFQQSPAPQYGQWRRLTTQEGREYFYNPDTREYSWELPGDYAQGPSTAGSHSPISISTGTTATPGSATIATPYGAPFQNGHFGPGNGVSSVSDHDSDSGYSAQSTTLPEGWSIFELEDGSIIYHNFQTQETRTTPPEFSRQGPLTSPVPATPLSPTGSVGSGVPSTPTQMVPQPLQYATGTIRRVEGLPQNWGKKQTPDGRVYYYHMLTDETTWNIEDVDPETGDLVRKANGKRDSASSEGSNDATRFLVELNANATTSNRMSWNRTTTEIVTAIQNLTQSAKNNHKEKFIAQSSAIVESIRVMLYASDTARKEGPVLASHRTLKVHHKHIMGSLSKLVLMAKQASGVWPPPDSVEKMQQAANDVFISVRQFVNAAQDAGVEIKEKYLADMQSGAAVRGQDDNGSMRSQRTDGTNGSSTTTLGNGQPTNSELIANLEGHTKTVIKMINSLVRTVRANQCAPSQLITQVRSMVTEVGNFLTVVDEIPLDSLNDELTVDFKVNRLGLYNSISGLVMDTQTATNQYAPANAVEQVLAATGTVERAIKDLLVSTKFLIEEKESLEQETLQNYLQKYGGRRGSDASYMRRRAMSTSFVSGHGPGSGSLVASATANAAAATAAAAAAAVAANKPPGTSESEHEESEYEETGEYEPPMFVGSGPPPRASLPSLPVNNFFNYYDNKQEGGPQQDVYQAAQFQQQQQVPTQPIRNGAEAYPNGSAAPQPFDNNLQYRRPSSEVKIMKFFGEEVKNLEPGTPTTPLSAGFPMSAGPLGGSLERRGSVMPEEKPWFLKYDYAPQDLVFTTEGKVKGGTLDALVERLTLHDSSDMNFMVTFLLTYRSFTDSRILLDLLIRRFTLLPPDGISPEDTEKWIESKLRPIQLRVYNVMKSWVDTYANDDDTDRVSLARLKDFALSPTMQKEMKTQGDNLARMIDNRLSGSGLARKMVQAANRNMPDPILPKNLRKIRLLELDPTEVARQLTIMESAAYNKIQPSELLKKAWSDKNEVQGLETAPNVRIFISISNQVTGWVAHTILQEKDLKKRGNCIKQFILIAEKCRKLNNFNTMMSIISGLESAHIHRLQRTWAQLTPRTVQSFDVLKNLMSSTKNFIKYREALHSVNPPCIPFLGFYLSDLTFIEDGNPDFLKGDDRLINFSKRGRTAEVIREVQQYQNTAYAYQSVEQLQVYLRQCLQDASEESDLYNMSLELEPREREDEKIQRLLQESGFL